MYNKNMLLPVSDLKPQLQSFLVFSCVDKWVQRKCERTDKVQRGNFVMNWHAVCVGGEGFREVSVHFIVSCC